MFRSAATIFLICAAPLLAQTATPPDGAPLARPGGQRHHHMGDGPAMYGEMRNLPATVANAPVTAQFISTGQMKGRDGAEHAVSGTRTVYRDSLGRTREDVTFAPLTANAQGSDGSNSRPHDPMNMTVIVDPVAGTIARLNPNRKTAMVETVPAQFFLREQRREQREENGQAGGKNAQVADLGSKTFAGVVAKGERVTHTMPARDTSDAAHTMTCEVWFSPDLKLEVSSSETGDRGTRSETATSISKAEPDASLFKVPEGYTVTQAAPRGSMGHGPHTPPGPDGEQTAPPPPAM